MDLQTLSKFLLESNAAGYATGEEKAWIKNEDKSTTIEFKSGDWQSNDNFFGGEPYGGRLVVFHKNKPVWIMVYYGWVEKGIDINEIYKVLREALKKMPADAPFRGPKDLKVGDYEYSNKWSGTVESYKGEEKITKGGEVVYEAKYIGGLVDQKEGV